jgi:glutamine synthetase
LTGKHETGSYDKFTWGDGNRGGSLRVPVITRDLGKGYLEDRRPASNLDPYLGTSALVDVCCLKGENLGLL